MAGRQGFAYITGLLVVVALVCLLVSVLFPRFRPPPTTGPYAVGISTIPAALMLNFAKKALPNGEHPAPFVQIWYPCGTDAVKERAQSTPRPLLHLGFAVGLQDAAPTSLIKRFPVLIYSAGWPGDQIQNYTLIRELVSHGLAVVSMTYPGMLPGVSPELYLRQQTNLQIPYDYSTQAAADLTTRLFETRVRNVAEDASSLIDVLSRLDAGESPTPFEGRLALDRTGIFGFSMGGAVAAQAAALDKRFRAAVNMDGRHAADALTDGVEQPYLFLGEVLDLPTAAELASPDVNTKVNAHLDWIDYSNLSAHLKRHGGRRASVSGTTHLNFSDYPLRSRIRRYSAGGTIDTHRALEIANAYVLAFFEQELLGVPQPLMEGNSRRFPEVRLEIWPGP